MKSLVRLPGDIIFRLHKHTHTHTHTQKINSLSYYTHTHTHTYTTHYVKLGKKRRESFKRNYYIISPRVIIKAIIIITQTHTYTHTHKRNSTSYLSHLQHHPGRQRYLFPQKNHLLYGSFAENDLFWWMLRLLLYKIKSSCFTGSCIRPNLLVCRSFSAKEPLVIILFGGKWPVKIRHPMHLCHLLPQMTLICNRDLSFIEPTNRSHPIDHPETVLCLKHLPRTCLMSGW